MKSLSKIRSLAIGRANQLQSAHRHLEALAPAFADWAAGEVYVCRKTGDYRYRFGDRSKSIAPWSAIAREVFATAEAFAFAALVLGEPAKEEISKRLEKPTPRPSAPVRANVIALAA